MRSTVAVLLALGQLVFMASAQAQTPDDKGGPICPPGRAPDTSNTFCEICAEGTYSDDGTECRTCPEGSVSNLAGSVTCTSCLPGTQPNSSLTECEFCAPGSYSIGGSPCLECAEGTVSPNPGSAT